MSNMMVLGGGAFGRVLGHEGGALMSRISALLRDITEFASSLYSLQEDSHLQMRKQVLTRLHTHPNLHLSGHVPCCSDALIGSQRPPPLFKNAQLGPD